MKRVFFYIGSVFCCVALSACGQKPDSSAGVELVRPAKIVRARSASDDGIRTYPGVVEAANQADLSFRVGGQLDRLPAKPGMRIKAGELLAALDATDYKNVERDRDARYKLALSQHQKILELSKKNFTSEINVEQSEAELKAAEAALRTAQDNVRYTRLDAPFDGVVAQVLVENHQAVRPQQAIIQVRGMDQVDIRYSIPESLVGKLKRIEKPEGLCAQVSFNAHPAGQYEACFKEFESVPDQRTRTYSVVHTMPLTQDFPVLPGMAVTVEIDLSSALSENGKHGVYVPVEAVFEEGEQSYVWRLDEASRTRKAAVTLDGIAGASILITSGLDAGDAVVAAGVSYLQEGVKVRPLVKERGL